MNVYRYLSHEKLAETTSARQADVRALHFKVESETETTEDLKHYLANSHLCFS